MVNDICERVVEYWEANKKLLPEIITISGDKLQEVIDGIDECHRELLENLREELCYF